MLGHMGVQKGCVGRAGTGHYRVWEVLGLRFRLELFYMTADVFSQYSSPIVASFVIFVAAFR